MFLRLYLIAIGIFTVVDMIWLGLVAQKFYRNQIGYIMAKQPNWAAAVVFYLLFLAGLVYFVISPAAAQKSWTVAAFNGALFGLITYATYDLTNLATLNKWPLTVTVVDMAWGTVLTATVSAGTILVAQKLGII